MYIEIALSTIVHSIFYSMEDLHGNPIFCVSTRERNSRKKLYVNFKSTDAVEKPPIDLDEDELVREICNPSPAIERYKIPLKLSQIFWTKRSGDNKERDYVIDVHINDNFAIRRVLVKDVIRHYVIIVALQTIENKYNTNDTAKTCGQFIGHQLDIDQATYEVLNLTQCRDRSSDLVSNKVLLLDEEAQKSTASKTNEAVSSEADSQSYDLFYRPGSNILTCSIATDKLPEVISFNDDRITVESSGKTLMDVNLPLFIDLREPMKYKFDDRLCLLRIVFKVAEYPQDP